jgi:hypothetical protein
MNAEYFEYELSLREKLIVVIRKIVSNPKIWYLSGMIDTLFVIWAYNHFIK